MMIKYSNYITTENIIPVLQLIIGVNWEEYFTKIDLEKIFFISKFVRSISVWASEYHNQENDTQSLYKNDEIYKTTSKSTQDIVENLLNITTNDGKSESGKISSIIINPSDTTIPSFLKTINDLIVLSPKKSNIKKINSFTKAECNDILLLENIKITKNLKSFNLVEDKLGTYIYIKFDEKYIVIQGIFKDDLLNISHSINFVDEQYNIHKNLLQYNIPTVPKKFKENFLQTLNLRDVITCTSIELEDEVKKKYNDFKAIQTKPLLSLINEFLLASKYRKIDILTLLLMSNEDDQKIAYILFDVFKSKDKKDIASEIYNTLHYSIRELLDISKIKVDKEEAELSKIDESDIPYERRISLMQTQDHVKTKAMEKLKTLKSNFQGDAKAQAWLDGLLRIPFGIYSQNEIINFKENFIKKINIINPELKLFSDTDIDNYINNLKDLESDNCLINEWFNYKLEKKSYLHDVRLTLDSAVYGHKEAKLQLERIFAQWINGETKGAVLGLQGPPGTGKTSLAKNGLSKCLKDKLNNSRPFAFLPIGGSVNGSTLVGHNFTYVGSTWGRIVDILMVAGCMNPIIFIDEIDKISHTEQGREIISILTHMTDSTQNDEFEDKFFTGIKIDLSKALIVFSFNDPDLIDPILRDRITII
jgi:ATP-dependent Lon protease